MRLLILCLAVAAAAANKLHQKHPCDDFDCRAGRECVVVEGEPQCLCIISCPDHLKPVCGSDEKSYENHCKMHQHACLSGEHIKIQHKGYCKKNFDKQWKKDKKQALVSKTDLEAELQNDLVETLRKSEKPITDKKGPAACYGPQRNAIRFLLVEHWQETLPEQPWHLEGMTYRESLWGWFFSCDSNKDNYLTPEELLKCAKDVNFFARPGQDNELTKELCIDALVDDGDKSNDWRLDFEEFTKVMDTKYQPKDKKCSLEGKNYLDGEEIHLVCNHCVCAVGNWVCASEDCKDGKASRKISKLVPFKRSGDIDNEIDELTLQSHDAAADPWTEGVLKEKNKAKSHKTKKDDLDDDDNAFLEYETGIETSTAAPIKEKAPMYLEDLYEDLYEKMKSKKKHNLQKTLKEVRMLQKKTNHLKKMLAKNSDDEIEKKTHKKHHEEMFKNYKRENFKKEHHRAPLEKETVDLPVAQDPEDEDLPADDSVDKKLQRQEQKNLKKHYSWDKYADDLFEKNKWNDLLLSDKAPSKREDQHPKKKTHNSLP